MCWYMSLEDLWKIENSLLTTVCSSSTRENPSEVPPETTEFGEPTEEALGPLTGVLGGEGGVSDYKKQLKDVV